MAVDIFEKLEQLIQYGINQELITRLDIDYTRNRLLEVLGLDEAEPRTVSGEAELEDILMPMLDWAVESGLIPEGTDTYRDLLDAKIMDAWWRLQVSSTQSLKRNASMKGQRRLQAGSMKCSSTHTIFIQAESPKMCSGLHQQMMACWRSQLIYQSRKRTQKQSLKPKSLVKSNILFVSFVKKTLGLGADQPSSETESPNYSCDTHR